MRVRMSTTARRLLPLLLLVGATACSVDTALPSTGPRSHADASQSLGRGDGDGDSDHESGTEHSDPADCQRSGEFGACLDASATPQELDASKTEDAGEKVDAGSEVRDAGSTLSDPCRPGGERACDGVAFGKVQAVEAKCDFVSKTSLRTRFSTCENCGTTNTLAVGDVEIRDCNGCAPVTAFIGSEISEFAPHACMAVDYTLDLRQTEIKPACFDVYGRSYGYTREQYSVFWEGSITYVRICRCSMVDGTCISCAHGACDEGP